jgi:hypothetical protein
MFIPQTFNHQRLSRKEAPMSKRNPKKTRPSRHPTYQEQTGSDGAFKNEIAALRRIFYDYTLVYDRAQTQQERDRAVEIMSLLSNRIAQLARSQHYITPPEDPQWKALMEAGEAILRDKPIMELFRPTEKSPHPGSQHPPTFPPLPPDHRSPT